MASKYKIIKNSKNNEIICKQVLTASSFFSRLKGLMFSRDLPECDGLLITSCNSIHTFFMNYSLDVIFLDNHFKVIKIIRDFRPWKMSWIYFKSTQVLELKAGSLRNDLNEGDMLEALDV